MTLPEVIPVFPLPNVVLLPRAVLPLHVFEERYREMTRDVLRAAGSRVTGRGLKWREGWAARRVWRAGW